jgi:hypothetical protein
MSNPKIMTKPRLTPEGLPIVHPGNLDSLTRDISSGSFDIRAAFDRIKIHNPEVSEYMGRIVEHLPQNERAKAAGQMIGVYELLRRQAESNQMEYKSAE